MGILLKLLTLSVLSVLTSAIPSLKLVFGADGSALAGPSEETASRTVEDGGTGRLKALMASDKTLPTHTVFRPEDLSAPGERIKLNCRSSPGETGHEPILRGSM